MSIGEVLNLLQGEFPDVTISKIRFLESQGLIDPERTPSGYRKFYGADVKRLRWILREQRENFLPLKVIKERLEAGDVDFDEPVVARAAAARDDDGDDDVADDGQDVVAEAFAPTPPAAPPRQPAAPDTSPPEPATAETGRPRVARDLGPSGISLTRAELAGASGLSRGDLNDLERFGLVSGRLMGDDVFYDEEALVVAKLAAGFRAHGVEARHLRMYKVAAEREAGFFEQVVMPLLKQRDPEARAEALEVLDRLTELGDGLRAAMLRQAMHEHLASD
jgi:DNA-binding transcriptional MerR regulator